MPYWLYICLVRPNESGCVFFSSSLYGQAGSTPQQKQHGALKSSTQRENSKTSIFFLSKCHHWGLTPPYSECLPVLAVSTWLNSEVPRTMEIQERLSSVTFVWRPARCLKPLCDGWRTCVNRAADGDLGRATSADIILLPAPLHQSCFPSASRDTEEDRGEPGRGSVWELRTAYLSESAAGKEK